MYNRSLAHRVFSSFRELLHGREGVRKELMRARALSGDHPGPASMYIPRLFSYVYTLALTHETYQVTPLARTNNLYPPNPTPVYTPQI